MKKTVAITLLLIILFSDIGGYAIDNLDCDASILVDAETGKTLFELNAQKIKYPASLTKLMTAVVAIDMMKLDDLLVVDDLTPFTIDGSHIALEPGEKISFEHMINALLIASANDVAEVIAINCSGSVEEFVEKMNEKAKEIGMVSTNFMNPHGLHDDNHYSTAEDMARLAVYAYQKDLIREIIQKRNYTIPPTNIKTGERYLNNSNRLLSGAGYGNQILIDGFYVDIKYDGATGMKTGYTPEAKSTFIGSAERGDISLISVVMDGYVTNVYSDTVKLLNYGFNNFYKINLINKNTHYINTKVKNALIDEIPLITKEGLTVLVGNGMKEQIVEDFSLYPLDLPIEKDTVVGHIAYKIDGVILGQVELITPIEVEAIEENSASNFEMGSTIKTVLLVLSILILLIFLLRIYNMFRLYRHRKNKKKRTGI
ncbi:MAG: D-alanyl-D-alanine carboxypeptidase family protein [Eubacteriales bacterium]|nr:D-alanyl-D-alanine carboxypeptidase family protein [Eubacteriales bacterium]